ncbi:SCO family protein [Alkalihalobacterium elongatum]|uniref:SCO family protein n=1 Tax=Alkalihalobacterium elongatum TaxID=2675466 RepID=UPI001C1FF783|nr:SCO family protein [Alkalihalobacterium elongatum]
MKHNFIHFFQRAKILLPVLVFSVLLSGCGWIYHTDKKDDSVGDLTAANLTVIPFTSVNQSGETVTHEDLHGSLWIANMVFTRCPTVCNLMTPNFRVLQYALEEEGLDVKMVSFTVDPDYDTPERLKKYGENNDADFSRWMFLTGFSEEDISEIATKTFQTLVQPLPDGEDIMHGTSFYLVDEEGNVIRMYDGLKADPEPIINDLKRYLQQ